MPEQVFISYSHKDQAFLDELLIHLKPLQRTGQVSAWSDRQIAAGAEWPEEIQTALERATVAVLLVTPAFLASDFIDEHELGPLLRAAQAGGVRLLWVPVKASLYEETPLQRLQAVLPPGQPLAQMSEAERDAAWVRVCKAIRQAGEAVPPRPATAPSAQSPALAAWREKLDFLLEQEALAADPEQKFRLRKLIEEARSKLQALGG